MDAYYQIVESNNRNKEQVYFLDFIESIKNVVSASTFEIHVKHLVSLNDYVFSLYNDRIRNIKHFMEYDEIKVIDGFACYLVDKRANKTLQPLYDDIDKIRYDVKIDQAIDEKTKCVFEKLFKMNKSFLWQIIPYERYSFDYPEFKVEKIKPIDLFWNTIKDIQDISSLEEALQKLCLINQEEELDGLLKAIKKLFILYHPDKNLHANSRLIYEKIELVYKPLNCILKHYEKEYGDTIFCDIRDFYKWNLNSFTDEKIHNHMLSMERPMGILSRRKLRDYRHSKQVISFTKDNIIEEYRKIISQLNTVITNLLKGINDSMDKSYKEELKLLASELHSQLKNLLVDYDDLKKEFEREITKLQNKPTIYKNDCYLKQKRLKNLNAMLNKLKIEENTTRVFLTKFRIKNSLNFIKEKGFFSSIKNKFQFRYINFPFNIVFNRACLTYNQSNLSSEYDYIISYSNLYSGYKCLLKDIKEINAKKEYFQKILNGLESEFLIIKQDFKTHEEAESEFKNNVLATKELKQKLKSERKEVENLRIQSEIAEAKVQQEKLATELEIKAKEEAELRLESCSVLYDMAENLNIRVKNLSTELKEYLIEQLMLMVKNQKWASKFSLKLTVYENILDDLKNTHNFDLNHISNILNKTTKEFELVQTDFNIYQQKVLESNNHFTSFEICEPNLSLAFNVISLQKLEFTNAEKALNEILKIQNIINNMLSSIDFSLPTIGKINKVDYYNCVDCS